MRGIPAPLAKNHQHRMTSSVTPAAVIARWLIKARSGADDTVR
jgi:hypothetical protein